MAILAEYHRPQSIREAVQLLRRTDVKLLPLAGGTRLVGALETRQRRDVDGVIDLRELGLTYVTAGADEIRIGATTTLSAVIQQATAGALAGGILRRTAGYEGPVNLRNAATVGGLIASAEMDSEFYAALLALDASVVSSDGETETVTRLADLVSPRQAGVLWAWQGGLITEVRIPLVELRGGHARVARTPSDRPIVAAVVASGKGVARVALCGVADLPILYTGQHLAPPPDFKGSTEYRRTRAEVVRKRAWQEAKEGTL